jgi:hypothetical protein
MLHKRVQEHLTQAVNLLNKLDELGAHGDYTEGFEDFRSALETYLHSNKLLNLETDGSFTSLLLTI